jgi:chemotaxis signal transduction protein
VVLTPKYKSLVLTVSSIQRIVPLDLSTAQAPPENSEKDAIRSVANLGETSINLLDTDKVIKQLESLYA